MTAANVSQNVWTLDSKNLILYTEQGYKVFGKKKRQERVEDLEDLKEAYSGNQEEITENPKNEQELDKILQNLLS